eukprot:1070251-Alexandrium_andersonii.AAC.1
MFLPRRTIGAALAKDASQRPTSDLLLQCSTARAVLGHKGRSLREVLQGFGLATPATEGGGERCPPTRRRGRGCGPAGFAESSPPRCCLAALRG